MLENIALFDMDGSLVDYPGKLRTDLLALQSPSEPPLGDIWAAEKLTHISARMRLIKSIPGWWRTLPTIEAGMQIFNLAREIGFTNHILTKGPRAHAMAWQEKVEWCHDSLPDGTPVHVTSDKSLVYGKVLYDDFPDYCRAWLEHRERGLVIMPVNPWNKDFNHPQVLKWDGTNIEQVREALLACLNRQPGEPLIVPAPKLVSVGALPQG